MSKRNHKWSSSYRAFASKDRRLFPALIPIKTYQDGEFTVSVLPPQEAEGANSCVSYVAGYRSLNNLQGNPTQGRKLA